MEGVLNKVKSVKPSNIIKVFLIAILFVGVILPLIFIFVELGGTEFGKLVSSKSFLVALGNSVGVSLATTVLSMGIAFLLAYLISNSKCRFKTIYNVIISIPMLIPSISHGTGIVTLFGESGLFTALVGGKSMIYGFWGVMLGSFFYSFPVAFLMFSDILKYQDRQIYQVADVMGIPKRKQFLNLTLPYIAKPCISIFFAVFTMIFTDYGVVMMVGGRFSTLPLIMYEEVIGRMNYGIGAVISIFLMIPAVIACIMDMLKKNTKVSYSEKKSTYINSAKSFDIATYVVCAAVLILILLPIVSFCIIGFVSQYPTNMSFTLSHFTKMFDMNLGQYLANSLIISVLASLIGMAVTYVVAYFASRTKNNIWAKVLHIFAMLSMAIPGIVLGISYLLLYGGSAFSRSLFILILVNIIHFFSSPYLLAYNAFGKVNNNYEVVVKTLGIGRFRYIVDILLPETVNTLVEMFTYFFVNCMVTISAVSFLATSNTNPLSLLINQMEKSMLIECIAVISLIILFVNVVVKFAVYLTKLSMAIHRKNKHIRLMKAEEAQNVEL